MEWSIPCHPASTPVPGPVECRAVPKMPSKADKAEKEKAQRRVKVAGQKSGSSKSAMALGNKIAVVKKNAISIKGTPKKSKSVSGVIAKPDAISKEKAASKVSAAKMAKTVTSPRVIAKKNGKSKAAVPTKGKSAAAKGPSQTLKPKSKSEMRKVMRGMSCLTCSLYSGSPSPSLSIACPSRSHGVWSFDCQFERPGLTLCPCGGRRACQVYELWGMGPGGESPVVRASWEGRGGCTAAKG